MYFPLKIYRCPCLCDVVSNHLDKQQTLNEIISFILNFNFLLTPPPKTIFCCKVGMNKENCFVICDKHLDLILFASQRSCRCLRCFKETMREYYEMFYFNDNFDY